jgi:hypothetical protein
MLPTTTATTESAWYLISVSELICISPTKDNALSFDGRGDEIYASAYIRSYDRTTGKLAATWSTRTLVYGDSANSTRLQAGTESAAGGIRAGDTIPDAGSVEHLVSLQTQRFPWQVWQGPLRDNGNALVISMSVWESDGRDQPHQAWLTRQDQLSSTLYAHSQVAERIARNAPFGPMVIGSTVQTPATSSVAGTIGSALENIAFVFPLSEVISLTVGGADRPVGLRSYSNSAASDIVLPNTVIVFTREMIETALNGPYLSVIATGVPGQTLQIPGPGYMIIHFADGSPAFGPGVYAMVLRVERTAGPPSSQPASQHQDGACIPKVGETFDQAAARLANCRQ